MSNRITLIKFLLLGFSDTWELQILRFVMFPVIYLAALIGNLLIITAIALDDYLHIPMYFFLVNLSIIDLCSISVNIPKSMANSLINSRLLSYLGCVTQVFLFLVFTAAALALLTVMSYDRYVTICQSVNYKRVINRRACVQMAASAWTTSIVTLHCTLGTPSRYHSANSVSSASSSIFKTVLRIPSEPGQLKVFSACLPHLTVTSLFLCTGIFVYLKPISSFTSNMDLMMSVLYALVPPMINLIIYSMRNNKIKAALKELIV
ncbi:olfactory receptor 14I1-like [Gopherus flavomarginatus]|uniref:olfactory receptor 14I1-like n=1 Tax=Gopherus flavomarginatus TaxID=286002 RepID=UPI0021CC3CB4|nr:olfactory receptor 14I1-like [Gopherus flavomarginatus]